MQSGKKITNTYLQGIEARKLADKKLFNQGSKDSISATNVTPSLDNVLLHEPLQQKTATSELRKRNRTSAISQEELPKHKAKLRPSKSVELRDTDSKEIQIMNKLAVELLTGKASSDNYFSNSKDGKQISSDATIIGLCLQFRDISNEGVKVLSEALALNNTVRSLDLGGNDIGDEGLEALAKMLESNSAITHLKLNHNKFTSKGLQALAKMLETNTSIVDIDLLGNHIDDEGAILLATALQLNKNISVITLAHNEISDKGTMAIANAIRSNKDTALTILHLSHNNIKDAGTQALGEILATNNSLRSLLLYNNLISDSGVESLSQGLINNSKLSYLHLSENCITNEGAILLAKMLESNTTLEMLLLDKNGISDVGVGAIAQALIRNKNTTLWKLHLNDNEIGDDGAKQFALMLSSNIALSELCLNGNHITDIGAIALADSLRSNKTLASLWLDNRNSEDSKIRSRKSSAEKVIQYSDAVATKLAEVLASNTTLCVLSIQHSLISKTGATALFNVFLTTKNQTVTRFYLNNTCISDQLLTNIFNAVSVNNTRFWKLCFQVRNGEIATLNPEVLDSLLIATTHDHNYSDVGNLILEYRNKDLESTSPIAISTTPQPTSATSQICYNRAIDGMSYVIGGMSNLASASMEKLLDYPYLFGIGLVATNTAIALCDNPCLAAGAYLVVNTAVAYKLDSLPQSFTNVIDGTLASSQKFTDYITNKPVTSSMSKS